MNLFHKKNPQSFSGVAIFIKHHINSHFIDFSINNNVLALKIYTSLGPLIIATSYSPPRFNSIPTIEINKLLNFNLPFLIISDFNARHLHFDNTNKSPNNKGKQLHSLIHSRQLSFLGPDFLTYRQGNKAGKTDLIICNNLFHIFHHMVLEGKPCGSDHIPIVFKIQTKPFAILNQNKRNINKISIDKYQDALNQQQYHLWMENIFQK